MVKCYICGEETDPVTALRVSGLGPLKHVCRGCVGSRSQAAVALEVMRLHDEKKARDRGAR
jgi:hypothetical protein